MTNAFSRAPTAPPEAVLSVAEMYAADAAAAKGGMPSLSLMEAAGAAIARVVRSRFACRPTLVLCGPGNNGGDGFVVARMLFDVGWPVRVALLGDIADLKGDVATNAARWLALGREVMALRDVVPALDSQPLVIDALFGAGLNRGLGGPAADAIARIQLLGLECVAVDVPSGVHGDSGMILTDPAFPSRLGTAPQCVLTVTFFKRKPAHLLYPGRALCGEVIVADIGIPETVLDTIQPQAWMNGPGLWTLPKPTWQSHKYTRGHAVVFGGADMTGAARLAGQAARRAGAGLLTYAVPAKAHLHYALDQPGAFVRSVESVADLDEVLSDPRKNALLIGPGFGVGAPTSSLVLRLLGTGRPVVLDADALTSFANDPALLFEAIQSRTAATILTPHEGEFGRLFRAKGAKHERARAAASQSGAVLILKGADTVIAGPDGRVAVNDLSAPWLATGGSGDVLSGLVLGLLAQGMTAWHAAAAAAWLHAKAGGQIGPGLIAEDLSEGIRILLNNIYNQYDSY